MKNRFCLALLGVLSVTLLEVTAQRFTPRVPPPFSGPPPPHKQGKERSQCALIIPGIGKSSSFDHFSGVGGGYNGKETCITYESVNAAFNAAREHARLHPPSQSLTDIDVDSLGNVLIETTRILAKQYGLPYDAISNGLPLIDTSKTIIDQYCPAYLKKPKCEVKRYREYNGLCNNLENPHWGATLTSLRRLVPAAYADGISEPRVSVSGEELPTTRYISAQGHHDLGYHDHAVTVLLPAWGQFIDHDMVFTAETKEHTSKKEPACCGVPPEHRHGACWPIDIPPNDPFYSLFRQRCMNFVRSGAGLQSQCRLGPRIQMNTLTGILDASAVYGSSKETADHLRAFKGGLMRTTPSAPGLKDLLPLQLESPDDGCLRPNPDTYCFLAGDLRVNQQMLLSVTHTIFVREHNRIASELSQINPHWDDERLFQETRHIVAAVIQKITYNEFLPMVLGKELMERYNLILQRDGHYNGYSPKADPTLPNEFVAAAFRFGHSLLPSAVERWTVSHRYMGSKRLSEMFRKPFDLYEGGTCDQYIAGFMNQVSQAVDESVTQELTNHLFQDPDKRWGFDLASLNMQRGRDHGIPSYNALREYCGLPRARSWDDLAGTFTNETLRSYASIYKTPDDIDLWSAGISERPLPGSMVGPTFGCIIGETFRNLRQGDRFWFENSGWPSSFSAEQLAELQKVKFSRIICDNSDHLETAQVYVMVLPSPDINPRVPCKSSVLPRMDLTKWRESPHQPSGYGNFPTLTDNPQTYFDNPPNSIGIFNNEGPSPTLHDDFNHNPPQEPHIPPPSDPQPPNFHNQFSGPPQHPPPHPPNSCCNGPARPFHPSQPLGHKPGQFHALDDPEPEPEPHGPFGGLKLRRRRPQRPPLFRSDNPKKSLSDLLKG